MMDINGGNVSDNQAIPQVISRFFIAYNSYDIEGMLSLHTEDVVWTWIDPARKIPVFGPEGKLVGTGKQEIRKFFEMDRGTAGFTGYILWSEVQGDIVDTIEIWQNDLTRAVSVPLITKSRYRLRADQISEWTWITSPESTKRLAEAAATKATSDGKST